MQEMESGDGAEVQLAASSAVCWSIEIVGVGICSNADIQLPEPSCGWMNYAVGQTSEDLEMARRSDAVQP